MKSTKGAATKMESATAVGTEMKSVTEAADIKIINNEINKRSANHSHIPSANESHQCK